MEDIYIHIQFIQKLFNFFFIWKISSSVKPSFIFPLYIYTLQSFYSSSVVSTKFRKLLTWNS